MEHNSAEYLHTLVEALRFSLPCLQHPILADPDPKLEGSPLQVISFVIPVGFFRDSTSIALDSQHYVTDPDLQYVPVKELLDKVS